MQSQSTPNHLDDDPSLYYSSFSEPESGLDLTQDIVHDPYPLAVFMDMTIQMTHGLVPGAFEHHTDTSLALEFASDTRDLSVTSDQRSTFDPRDRQLAPSSISEDRGHPHTTVHPDKLNPSVRSESDPSTNQRVLSPTTDPIAAEFLREQLGPDKWGVFSARLYERRLSISKAQLRSSSDAEGRAGASILDFLVKVEVVKEVLRTYVPHPYNPLKSLTHPYDRSPTGQVTLTRSTILALSGWSNTQFSYWARRVEATSVLASYDDRLRALAGALKRRLDISLRGDASSSSSAAGDPAASDNGVTIPSITGKGLDILIDEVKKQTGKAPFIREKHASLDAFDSVLAEESGRASASASVFPAVAAPVFRETFQAVAYTHSPPPPYAPKGKHRCQADGTVVLALAMSGSRPVLGEGLEYAPRTCLLAPRQTMTRRDWGTKGELAHEVEKPLMVRKRKGILVSGRVEAAGPPTMRKKRK